VAGQTVDLGRVGVPSEQADPRVLMALVSSGFVPVLACIGVSTDGGLLNVNADTFAGHLAAAVSARRLVIAGTTAGVLDDKGQTTKTIELRDVDRLISGGTATAGMIAKLRACEHALRHGAADVVIVDGGDSKALVAAARGQAGDRSTRIVHATVGSMLGQK
jgi:acetylglutamate kinase